MTGSTVLAGGVHLEDHVCLRLFVLLSRLDPQHPTEREAVAALKTAGQRSVGGPISWTSADITALSKGDRNELTTDALAVRLRVGPRHARRLAAAHGIEPLSPNRWATADADALLAHRNATT